MQVGRYFVLGLLAFGVVTGFAVARLPQLQLLPAPAFTLPLILSFVLDLALMPLVRAGRIEPLTMEQRGVGVIGAALIAIAIVELLK